LFRAADGQIDLCVDRYDAAINADITKTSAKRPAKFVSPVMRVTQIDGVPIPADWPEVRRNSKFRTPAAVEVARSLIAPVSSKNWDTHRFRPESSSKKIRQPQRPATRKSASDFAQSQTIASVAIDRHPSRKNLSELRVTPRKPPGQLSRTPDRDAEIGLLAESGVVMQKSKKTPDAIEAARALVKVNAKSSARQSSAPIQFERADIDPREHVAATQKLSTSGKKRGRPRKQPPIALRDQMPEHRYQALSIFLGE
jgi:hypothetical protein